MRRYNRRYVSRGWKGSFLARTTPEEKTFELLDAAGNRTGQLVYTDYEEASHAKARTPWGEAGVIAGGGFLRDGTRGFLTVALGERAIVGMVPHLLRWDFSFANGSVMSFKMRPWGYSLTYSGETGTVRVLQEEGTAPESERSAATLPTGKDLRKLPKEKRPRTIETNQFQQWTISVSGILPVEERDVVASLIMFTSLECLDFENTYGR